MHARSTHHAVQDNGVKLVDPRGEMLESSWEVYATSLANAPSTDEFVQGILALISELRIDMDRQASIVYARDTRPSGASLVAALRDGIRAIGAIGRDQGVTTTPILHYIVRCINTKGTLEAYGEDSEEGYMKKMSAAYKTLVVSAQGEYEAWMVS